VASNKHRHVLFRGYCSRAIIKDVARRTGLESHPEWKPQQKILWAEVKKETGKWKDWWKVRDLLADGRCSQAVLDFLVTTDVGKQVPGEEDDAVSAVSELEVQEWLEEHGAGAVEPDVGGELPLFLPTPHFMAFAGEG